MNQDVMWRRTPREALHTIDDQDWPAQPHTLPLPNPVLREAASNAELTPFFAVGEAWAQMVSYFLPREALVLDIGCGCGKLARFLYLNPGVRYMGIDIFQPSIRWCQKVFEPTGRFRFIHFDGRSEVYNPTGQINPSEYVLPVDDQEVDMVVCASLFTHLYEPDARHYLSQIRRVLKADGQAIVSIHDQPANGPFCGDEARIDIAPDYFVAMCRDAQLAAERIGVIYGQTAYRLRAA